MQTSDFNSVIARLRRGDGYSSRSNTLSTASLSSLVNILNTPLGQATTNLATGAKKSLYLRPRRRGHPESLAERPLELFIPR